MKTLLLGLTLLTSISGHATMTINCTGETEKEILQFVIAESSGITLTKVSEDLCDYSIYVDENEKGQEGVYLSRENSSQQYSTWEGSWGFKIKVPRSISEGSARSKTKFKAQYEFEYSDIAESVVTRELDCQVK